ncbi:bifunctional 4-hydroxy-2-oxoglutarate aldolase/2-dehydro-3-deoxy-phosphogluconate aldolase [Rhodococcus sp. 27YEA15]|uniref:bifunctional 4-hydroxy-2-oxoglutarate aldolase/2-dehydro-3-deoxy-phosphogluconate aldolase n=1 Tax=Rhodococcus sp. 27YEA15 TaxID=3156259 RepID=UPI003C7D516C
MTTTHSRMQRVDPATVLGTSPVVAVLRAEHALEYPPVIDALVRGGVTAIELTLSTAGVFEVLPALIEEFGDRASIGVGTVTNRAQAESLLELGARFLVTPTMNLDVIAAARAAGVPVFPGGLTPTELFSGWEAGASAVKLFPAATVGTGYIAQLRGPFPDIEVVPSGGVSVEDAPTWIASGAAAVSLGGPLLQDAFSGGDLSALTARARTLVAAVDVARTARGARK